MGLKLKDGINPEILRDFGFHLGKEYFGKEKWCGDGCGYEYQANWYHKFLTIDWNTGELGAGFNDIAYADDDIPMVHIMFRIGSNNDLYIDCAPDCTYHIGGDELDIVADTIYELVNACLLDKS